MRDEVGIETREVSLVTFLVLGLSHSPFLLELRVPSTFLWNPLEGNVHAQPHPAASH